MRISEAVGGTAKQATKETAVEAQQDNGRRRRHPVWVAATMLTASIVVIVIILAGLVYFANFPSLCGTDDTWDLPEDLLLPVEAAEPRVVPHSSWSLRPQQQTLPLAHPTPYVVVKHTAGPTCSGLEDCTPVLRAIQELQWQRYDQPEIAYNFLIDSDGNIYEGRGWNSTNTNKGMVLRCNVDVALIGNFVEQNMTQEMSSALRWLLEEGVRSGMLARDYRLLAHNQVRNTLSPGRAALLEIAEWPHRCLQHCDRGAVCIRPDDTDVTTSR